MIKYLKVLFYIGGTIFLFACEDSQSTSLNDAMVIVDVGQSMTTDQRLEVDQLMRDRDLPDMDIKEDMNNISNVLDAEVISLSLSIDEPQTDMIFDHTMPITAYGQLEVVGGSLEFVVVEAILDEQESLPVQVDRSRGVWSTLIDPVSPGSHTLLVTAAMAPDYRTEVSIDFTIICDTTNDFSMDLDPTLWVAKGPTIRDERGWVELTQNQLNTRGALFWAGQPVQAGNLDVEFSFSTSKCPEPGSCDRDRINAGGGFSINFWDIRPQELEALWDVTRGLGHVTPEGILSDFEQARAESFHVVFDTYSNSCAPCGQNSPYDGCGNQHEEPTHENHVAIYRNGHAAIHGLPDMTNSYCYLGPVNEEYMDYWSAYPDLDNGEWHQAHLIINGTTVELSIDDIPQLSFDLPNLRFKGGILSLSAGSGVNGNFHRIDNLRVNNQCQ